MPQELPDRTVERLSAYRRLLRTILAEGQDRVYSHEIARRAGVTPAQVRRDLMLFGYTGSPAHGYEVAGLIEKLGELFDPRADETVVLVGVGHLGYALVNYFQQPRSSFRITAAFDVDPELVGTQISGCRIHPITQLEALVSAQRPGVAILAVPANAAQDVADRLVSCGVRAILNFAPVRLRLPTAVAVEDVDLSVSIEKLAVLARRKN